MADVRDGARQVGGEVAHDAVDAGNPVKIGGKAASSVPTAVANADRVNAFFDLAGRQAIAQKSDTTAVSQVASSASNVTLKAANTARLGLSIHNDSTQVLYVKLGATASATSYTVKMAANSHYETPFGYTGIVDGIWASANGNAYVTEIT